mgnify:CR=1 FL=1
MFFEPENSAAIKTDALKNTVAVKQAVVENGNLSAGLVEKFAIDINFRLLGRAKRRLVRRLFSRSFATVLIVGEVIGCSITAPAVPDSLVSMRKMSGDSERNSSDKSMGGFRAKVKTALLLARQRHEIHRQHRALREFTDMFFEQIKLLHFAPADRNDHAASFLQLIDQRLRNDDRAQRSQ